jgi:NADH dehydrogenase
MDAPELNVVTGAFSYTGKYIARRLLSMGKGVITLTGHPNRPNPFGDRVSVAPFHFDNPTELAKSLQGAKTLFNTYWVRFPYGEDSFEKAIRNTKTLIEAAKAAGVRRIVHISVTNASEDSSLSYFRGKGRLENAIVHSGLSYAIIRPTLVFGAEDILINNIAWLLRRFPVFAVPGTGDYRVQPVFVEDVAELAVRAAQQEEDVIVDAAGPETYTFDELVRLIASTIHSRARIIHLRPGLALLVTKAIGGLVRDVVLTREEIDGLIANLLISEGPPTGQALLSDWLRRNGVRVGARYASELSRHFR